MGLKVILAKKQVIRATPTLTNTSPVVKKYLYDPSLSEAVRREMEWVDKLREQKLPIRETFLTVLSDNAPRTKPQPHPRPSNFLKSSWNAKRTMHRRFGKFDQALKYADELSGRQIHYDDWHKNGSIYRCTLDVKLPSFASGYQEKTLYIVIRDTKSKKAGRKYIVEGKILKSKISSRS